MTKTNTKAEGNANNLTQIKVTRGANAVASAIANILHVECGIATNRAELVQIVERIPYPEELPAGTENLFNMASVLYYSPVIPEDANKLGNYKVTEQWLNQKEELLEVLGGHLWSRVSDRNNTIDCTNQLNANSALVLGDALSGLRRALKVKSISDFTLLSKPNKVLAQVDWCCITLFEVYAFDESLAQGKARFWTFYLDFKGGKGNCSDCGEMNISELINELGDELEGPSLDVGERSWEREEEEER